MEGRPMLQKKYNALAWGILLLFQLMTGTAIASESDFDELLQEYEKRILDAALNKEIETKDFSKLVLDAAPIAKSVFKDDWDTVYAEASRRYNALSKIDISKLTKKTPIREVDLSRVSKASTETLMVNRQWDPEHLILNMGFAVVPPEYVKKHTMIYTLMTKRAYRSNLNGHDVLVMPYPELLVVMEITLRDEGVFLPKKLMLFSSSEE